MSDDHEHGHAHEHGHSHHAHEHGHSHHAHEHGHSHDEPRERPMRNEQLEAGAGAGRTLFFDAFSGVAGDMTIAALLDLGVPLLVIEKALAQLPLEDFHVHRSGVEKSSIAATKFDVVLDGVQPMRTYRQIDTMLADSPLDPGVRALARRIFRRLAEAEATIHAMPVDDVHFHEVGAVDAIVDIVGSAAALTYLGAEVVGSPVPLGRGFVKAAHGVLPLPAPATVLCLKGYPTVGTDLEEELVTPTGAAILATCATRCERWPTIAPERIGFGAGTKTFPDRPNLLRVVLGRSTETTSSTSTHVLVEANVDDLTGEVASHAISALFEAGAVDAWAIPITMKKGRPALTLAALAPTAQADLVAETMLRETSSIGVRRTPMTRTERPRRVISVSTPYGSIRVKVSEGPFGPPQVKPEFDDCAEAARAANVPVREVIDTARRAATDVL